MKQISTNIIKSILFGIGWTIIGLIMAFVTLFFLVLEPNGWGELLK